MHYNDVFCKQWQPSAWQIAYQPSCLIRPYHCGVWPIRFPDVQWTHSTIVVLHTQDFLSIDNEGCVELRNIEKHFGDHSHEVIVIHWNYGLEKIYQGTLNLIYFPTHTYEILHNLNSESFRQWRDTTLPTRTLRWQCLNGIPRPHRRCVHDWLKPYENGITSLGNIDPLPKHAYHDVYDWEQGDVFINENNLVRLSWLYDHAWINIVTETQYTESPGIISEKTIFALLSRQIPIIIGYRGMVEHCRQLGFDMFDDIVDHSYDNEDDMYRWQHALEYNRELITGSTDLSHLLPRLQAQREWILNEWPRLMISHHDQRCSEIKSLITTVRDRRT
jgi:hypothetical protein